MSIKVTGIDLANVTLGEALEALVFAWGEAQNIAKPEVVFRPEKPLLSEPELDPWFHRILDWTRGHYASGDVGSVAPGLPFTTDEALVSAGLERGKTAEMRAARILLAIGYKQSQQRRNRNANRVRVWKRSP